jgi:hypothetical protein
MVMSRALKKVDEKDGGNRISHSVPFGTSVHGSHVDFGSSTENLSRSNASFSIS